VPTSSTACWRRWPNPTPVLLYLLTGAFMALESRAAGALGARRQLAAAGRHHRHQPCPIRRSGHGQHARVFARGAHRLPARPPLRQAGAPQPGSAGACARTPGPRPSVSLAGAHVVKPTDHLATRRRLQSRRSAASSRWSHTKSASYLSCDETGTAPPVSPRAVTLAYPCPSAPTTRRSHVRHHSPPCPTRRGAGLTTGAIKWGDAISAFAQVRRLSGHTL
jgi:hypothetical protein